MKIIIDNMGNELISSASKVGSYSSLPNFSLIFSEKYKNKILLFDCIVIAIVFIAIIIRDNSPVASNFLMLVIFVLCTTCTALMYSGKRKNIQIIKTKELGIHAWLHLILLLTYSALLTISLIFVCLKLWA